MKDTAKKTLRKNLSQPANRIVSTVRENPYSSLATLATIATVGIGVAFLRTNGRQTAAWKNPAPPSPKATFPEDSYFEAAPRSISGSHQLQLPATAGSGTMVKKNGSLIFGSAVFLTSLYLLGRKM